MEKKKNNKKITINIKSMCYVVVNKSQESSGWFAGINSLDRGAPCASGGKEGGQESRLGRSPQRV